MKFKSLFQKIAGGKGTNRQPVQPPVLGSAIRFPYGAFKFKARLASGIAYEIEATTNLTAWTSISTDTSLGEIDYVDANAAKFGHRFYRLNVDGVFSTNVIGYATITLPPGFSMIANPLEAMDNSVAELFKGMPEGTTLSRFDTRLSHLTENAVKLGKWTNPTEKILPGEGAMFFNPTSDYKNLNFVGEVKQGKFSTPIPAGFSIRSSSLPQPGRLDTDLGFPADEGDVIHLFDRDRQKYVLYPYDAAVWVSNPPVVSVGESFWVAKKSPKNWIRSFSVTEQ